MQLEIDRFIAEGGTSSELHQRHQPTERATTMSIEDHLLNLIKAVEANTAAKIANTEAIVKHFGQAIVARVEGAPAAAAPAAAAPAAAAAAPAVAQAAAAAAAPAGSVTFDMVKTPFLQLANGFRAKAEEVLAKHGVKLLSQSKPEQYAAILADVNAALASIPKAA